MGVCGASIGSEDAHPKRDGDVSGWEHAAAARDGLRTLVDAMMTDGGD
jgi:hypothetical protein